MFFHKTKLSSLDDQKNNHLTYYYSRTERKAKKPIIHSREFPLIKLFRIKSKNSILLLTFFIILSIFFWYFYNLYNPSSNQFIKKEFHLKNQLSVQAVWISNQYKHGINLLLDNRSLKKREIQKIKLTFTSLTIETNIPIIIEQQDFQIIYLPVPVCISNIRDLNIYAGEN